MPAEIRHHAHRRMFTPLTQKPRRLSPSSYLDPCEVMNMNRSLMVAVGAFDKTVLRGAQKIARLQQVTDAKDQCPMWPVTCTFTSKPGSKWLAVGGTRQLKRRRERQLGKIITNIAFQEEHRGGVSRLI